MGRKTKPAFLTVIDGNRGHRAGGAAGKRRRPPKMAPLPVPDHLTPHGKRAWLLPEPVVRRLGVLRPEQGIALEQTCEIYAELIDLRKELDKNDRFYTTTNKAGDVMRRPHPAAGMKADCERRLLSYLSEFGLTPSSLAKLLRNKGDHGDQDEDKTSEFFG